MGVLRGMDSFEGRSSFKLWLYRILVNRARSLQQVENLVISPWTTSQQLPRTRFDEQGAWAEPLDSWVSDATTELVAASWAKRLNDALAELPDRQRTVVTLRDVEGLASEDVCGVLGISDGSQRVLLHRGRSRLRTALEAELRMRGR